MVDEMEYSLLIMDGVKAIKYEYSWHELALFISLRWFEVDEMIVFSIN